MADIVVNISRVTAGITRAGFGIPLILTNTAHTFETYTTLAEVEADFATTTTVYAMATALKSQEFEVPTIAIAGVSYTEENTVGAETLTNTAGNTYSFANTNIEVNSIAGLSDGGGAIPDADIDSIDYVAGTITFTGARTGSVTVTGYTSFNDPAAFTTLLNTLVSDGRDFYGILTEGTNYRLQKSIDTWVATQTKLYALRTQLRPADSPVSFTTRTGIYYHTTSTEYPDAAVFGQCLPKDPGSLTWKNQTIVGITPEILTSTTVTATALETARYNAIIRSYGVIVTSNGFLAQTLFIDQQRSQDYVKIRMEENIASLLINNDKIPFDDTGIVQVVSQVEATLNDAFDNGIIAADAGGQAQFTVTSTPAADIPQQDKTDRVLRTVSFSYIEAGAVEGAEITGRIVASL